MAKDQSEDEKRREQAHERERADAKAREREAREEREAGDAPLTDHEREKMQDARPMSSLSVYNVIRLEGLEELQRPTASLWWSGVAAGIGISSSVLAEGILHEKLEGSPYREIFENFGYTVGFVLVILARMQLFTENTITVVLPLLARPTKEHFWFTGRLWSIVFAANVVGTFLTAAITLYVGTGSPEQIDGMMAISRKFAENSFMEALVYGIPAGFFIAAIVWMLPSARGSAIWVIILFTYLIAIGDFTHVIAGSTEMWLLVLQGEMGVFTGFGALILPTFIGNVIGGTGLFALLAYGQVYEEM